MYYNEFQQLTAEHFVNWAKIKYPNVIFYSRQSTNSRYVHLVTPLCVNLLDPLWINRISKFHPEAYKLTSSQVMCLNFFEPFLSSKATEASMLFREFLKVIQQQLNLVSSILNTNDELCFYDYELNFLSSSIDLYIKTKDDYEYFCEIKYTEKEFGKFGGEKSANQTYVDKLQEVFDSRFRDTYNKRQSFINQGNKTVCLEDFFGIEDSIKETKKKLDYKVKNPSYSNYQINRNVILANSDKKFTVFIYPFIREDISLELENYKNQKNVVLLDWKYLSTSFCNAKVNSKGFTNHYLKFHDKYIWW